jgi:hypothetical protein
MAIYITPCQRIISAPYQRIKCQQANTKRKDEDKSIVGAAYAIQPIYILVRLTFLQR